MLTLSSSSFVLSSMARMSSMVRPCQRSIQQNTCLQDTQSILLLNFGFYQDVGGMEVPHIAFALQ
jgi:hypothetical protein